MCTGYKIQTLQLGSQRTINLSLSPLRRQPQLPVNYDLPTHGGLLQRQSLFCKVVQDHKNDFAS